MQTLYAYSGRDAAELQRGLADMVHHEFTDGELDIAPRAPEVRAFIRTGLSGPVTFMHSLNGTDISFRRCWHHIRARKAAVRLLYFVLQGDMQVVSAAVVHGHPGPLRRINADEPFYTRYSVPEGGSFECALGGGARASDSVAHALGQAADHILRSRCGASATGDEFARASLLRGRSLEPACRRAAGRRVPRVDHGWGRR